jgi:hypothetical protein
MLRQPFGIWTMRKMHVRFIASSNLAITMMIEQAACLP